MTLATSYPAQRSRTFRKRRDGATEARTPSAVCRIVDGVFELLVDDASVRLSPEGYVEVRIEDYGLWLDPGLLSGVGSGLLVQPYVGTSKPFAEVSDAVSLRSEAAFGLSLEVVYTDAIGFEVYVR